MIKISFTANGHASNYPASDSAVPFTFGAAPRYGRALLGQRIIFADLCRQIEAAQDAEFAAACVEAD